MLDPLFQQFTKEKRYLKNVSLETLIFYEESFKADKRTLKELATDIPTNQILKEFVIRLKESGISTASVNTRARGINSFPSWLHENGHTPEKLRIKPLKEEQKLVPTYSAQHLKTLLSFKARTRTEKWIYALVCFLMDTGARITEALTLERSLLGTND